MSWVSDVSWFKAVNTLPIGPVFVSAVVHGCVRVATNFELQQGLANGSKGRFLGGKHSVFLNRDRGHDRHSANGYCYPDSQAS